MSPIVDALTEFDDEEVTAVEDTGKIKPRCSRRPTDAEIERITLQRPAGAAVRFEGAGALAEAQLMLDAWAAARAGAGLRRGQDAVKFSVYFGDGLVYSGEMHIRRQRDRNLVRHLRKEENFRAAFCPDLDSKAAAGLFALFAASYRICFPGREQSGQGPQPLLSECTA